VLEALVGYPAPLFRAIRHPVMWIGALIEWLDRIGNPEAAPPILRKLNGVFAVIILAGTPAFAAALLQRKLLDVLPFWEAVMILELLCVPFLAQRSLWTHVANVESGLRRGGIAEGRRAVSMIVGRNPATLDEAGVVRAAIESLAENFSDGVVAPALWCALLGLPGIIFYKAVNTADSMIGHRTPRHQAFGWASARLDDVINLPASRLAAVWIILAALLHGADAGGAIRAVWRDAGHHRSPNAGYPEAAMAGALGLRLAGPRVYGSERVDDAWMGDGRAAATTDDLTRALKLYRTACGIQIAVAFIGLLIARG